ncbi:PP2C family protein-serine/threonine phosphatase [Clostridium sp. ZS2-4]|uniref:PP2C family protein-serine/threonine phosphatase n=1 Tax=Clostridium sp. ZS2-4 TaxID=2987703 RepID=UPI00227B6DFD|nr:SpoIIE family protein phosphatase [Clostridium sp. ZS2-4]MCY6355725.1 SpoIIE family protein phosphatase [Clostridium sp. ZS2-4]
MRKLNSKFKTNFISEAGSFLQNKDYFAFVELDDYACYVIADGIDNDLELESAKIAVTSIIRNFTEKPTIKKRHIKRFIKQANDEMISKSSNVRLKASITIMITNYTKVVYAVAGNTRFYLFRNGFLRYKSEDQSLTQVLADKEEVPLDKIAKHNERNNLYCYLGQNKLGKPYISRKIKLMEGDIIALLTRGIWENIDEQEMEDAVDEAKDPEELCNNIEDMLLSKQLKEIENYTLSFTFVDKVFVNPNRKKKIKKIITILLPILIILIIGGVMWNINRNKRINSINEMNTHKVNGREYIENGNMIKANKEYKAALDIATKYKLNPEKNSLDKYYKFTDIILDADDKLKEKKYKEALDKYLAALGQSENVDNITSKYISHKLEIVRNALKVTDLLTLGDKNFELKNIQDAESAYKQAKDLATDFYLVDERKEAMDKLDKVYNEKAEQEKQAKDEKDKKEKEDEKKEKEKLDIQDKAVENTKQGDMSYSTGDYISAKMYYTMAKQMYEQINLKSFLNDLEEKIHLMDKKINEAQTQKSQADKYAKDGDEKYIKGDANTAKVLYLLAKDIYEKEGLVEEAKKIQEKLDIVNKAITKK